MRFITAFFMAWGNFFAVPCPVKLWDNGLRRLQLVFFPIIGLMAGAAWYGMYKVMDYFDIPYLLSGAVMASYPFLISGFIHLDGFMDCSDAELSRRDMAEKQRILKDSHVGAFAVISVVLLFMFSYGSMATVMMHAPKSPVEILVILPFISRTCSAIGVLSFRPMGHSQYKESFKPAENRKYLIVLYVFFALSLIIPMAYFKTSVITCAGIVSIVSMKGLTKQLGGMSGDVAGYGLTVSEGVGMFLLALEVGLKGI